jgi:hypothetical protein
MPFDNPLLNVIDGLDDVQIREIADALGPCQAGVDIIHMLRTVQRTLRSASAPLPGPIYTFPWHNDQCVRERQYIGADGYKRFWCKTHGQWAAEKPVSVERTFFYGDGDLVRKVGPL